VRALIGCPIFSYGTSGQNADTVHAALLTANTNNYVLGSGTIGGSDTLVNSCGIAMSHAYSLISVFNIYDTDTTTVLHKMYMIRNPWGVTYYNGTWKHDDSSWTSAFKAQVPHSVDPTTSNA